MKRHLLILILTVSALCPAMADTDTYGDADASSSVLSALNMEKFDEIKDNAIDGAMEMERYARLIAGLGTLLYLCTILWRSWGNNQPIDFGAVMRPLAVFLLIVFFYAVPQFIETMASPLNTATSQLNEEARDDYKNAIEDFSKKYYLMQSEAVQKEEGDESVIASMAQGIIKIAKIMHRWFSFDGMQITVQMAFNSMCVLIFEGLAKVVVVCLHVFSLVAKVVLILIGPICFALSLFPYFHESMKLWFCRYVNLCLYIPICNIIGYVLKHIYINIFYAPAIEILDSGKELTMFDIYAAGSFSIIFLIVGIIMYCMVPKLAGWVIDGQGNGLIGSAVGNVASAAGRYGAGAAGAAAGAAKTVA